MVRIIRGDTSSSVPLKFALPLNELARILHGCRAALDHRRDFQVLDDDDAVFFAIIVVALCTASFRRRAYLACNLATLRRAFAQLREPLARRAKTHCAFASRSLSAVVVRGRSITVPSDSTMGGTPPRSMSERPDRGSPALPRDAPPGSKHATRVRARKR
jgi:hypothetical protein